MLPPRLPEQITPFKFARQRMELSGALSIGKMARLSELLADNQGEVKLDLHFGIDEQGVNYMRGSLEAQVNVVCQRCMEPMSVPLECEIAVGFVSSDERARSVPEPYEAYIVNDETAVLAELIEDELILALPLVAMHPNQSCQPWFETQQEESGAEDEGEERKNPFAVLASLKQGKDK